MVFKAVYVILQNTIATKCVGISHFSLAFAREEIHCNGKVCKTVTFIELDVQIHLRQCIPLVV